MIISFFLSLADNKYRDRVRDRFSGEKGKGRVCRWLVRREDEVSLVLEQWGMTRASGSVHVLLPVTRRLIDSQPSCSVNVVYRVSSVFSLSCLSPSRREPSSSSFDVDETIYKES